MANTKERIDALEAQIHSMFKSDQDDPGKKQFSLCLDSLEVNLEATNNTRYAENMKWEGKFQELQDRVEHHARHIEENTAFDMRKALLECKHTGSVREYCQAFSALMLDISDMSTVDRLFFFMEGLKPWARTELNRRRVQRGEQSGSRSRHPPTDEQTDAQDYEEEDAAGAFPQWCNAVTTQVGNPEKSLTGEEPKDMPPKKKADLLGKGLMYVDIKVNGKAIRTMVDTRATHNYISSIEVERLGLTLEKGYGRVKAINSAAQPVAGKARSVLIKIGPYEGRTNFLVVIMDDFKLILGLEFLHDTKTTVMPCTNSLAMLGSKQWQELLAEFNFMHEYKAGSTNSVADALSRRAELDQEALMAMNAIVRADSRVAINI
ncbi:hypothetical protein RJ639_001971 [Escallonia herrerae]|uniref:Retrotransposon gag domain-containing protein n=1 Tax=Escallonia herrerae TaxID=1293975 RepID=A0AA88XSJ0_9ASTE|nr:hypothetical protein RJ639_001971 [Escallonia herrerae]